MGYLILAICSSAMISIVMRFSEKKVRHNIGMLVMNYAMCSLLGLVFAGAERVSSFSDPGLLKTVGFGIVNGGLYLISFVLFQRNIQRSGVVLSAIFMKLGLLVTMVVSVCVYGETPGLYQGIGFVLAVGAIVCINAPARGSSGRFGIGLPVLLLCGGMADAMSKIFEQSGVPGMDDAFLFYTFCVALILCIGLMVRKKQRVGKWEMLFGLLIGVPNFLSTKFLLRALEAVPAVIAFPVYSVGGILAVTLAGVFVFREKLRKHQWAALGIILAALVLLNL